MSISTSWYAEYANKKKKEWSKELEKALELEDWKKVKELINKINNFYFSE